MRHLPVNGIVLAALAVTLGSTAVLAQEASSSADLKSAAPANLDIQEVVVTAQRREQRVIDVPISVQALTGEALTAVGITDARSLERISPALSFSGSFSSTSTSFSMRGVQSLVDDAAVQPSVGVVIDNVPVARQGEVVLELADIDRVEVLSGPQGTLFGKNATAGVINIVSNRPKPVFGGSAEVSGTTDEEITAKAMVNVPLSDKIAARFNGYYDHMDPLIKNISPLGEDAFGNRSYGMQGKVLFNLTDTTNILVGVGYRNFDGGAPPVQVVVPNSGALGVLQKEILGAAVGWGKDIINQDTPIQNRGDAQSYTMELNSKLRDDLSLVAISGYRKYHTLFGPDTDAGPTGDLKGRGIAPNPVGYPIEFVSQDNPSTFNYKYFSQEVRLAYSAPGVDVVGGLFYQNYDETQFKETADFLFDGSFVGLPPGARYYVGNFINEKISDDTGAVFADATVEIVPTFKLFGGVRYTKEKLTLDYSRTNFFMPVGTGPGFFDPVTYVRGAPPTGVVAFTGDSRTDSNVSGRAGIQWEPQRNLNYYASFSRGYKGPAANGSQQITGPNDTLFAPEIATAYEIGAKQRFMDGRIALDIALYKQKIDNIQITAVPPGTVFPSLTNAGALKTQGFELSLTGRPMSQLTLSTSVVYNDAKYSGPYTYACGPSATPGEGSCMANGQIALDGTRAVGVPVWKIVSTASYEHDLTGRLKLIANADYSWRTSIQYQLQHDPLTEQGSYGLLNASLGVGSTDDHWQVTAFVKNATNKFNYTFFYTVDQFLGESTGYPSRDFARYGGLRVNYRF